MTLAVLRWRARRKTPENRLQPVPAEAHRRAGLAAVTGEHYEGGHWLGSFAVYLTTKRGIEK